MPQFDTSVFVGQIFWMLISFGGLYLGIRFIVFPLFNHTFQMRNQLIENPVEQAERLTNETQKLQEILEQKQIASEQKNVQKLNEYHQKLLTQMEQNLKQKDAELLAYFKRKIQKIEQEEKQILQKDLAFVSKAMKGIK